LVSRWSMLMGNRFEPAPYLEVDIGQVARHLLPIRYRCWHISNSTRRRRTPGFKLIQLSPRVLL
jgi:hypothetical protein